MEIQGILFAYRIFKRTLNVHLIKEKRKMERIQPTFLDCPEDASKEYEDKASELFREFKFNNNKNKEVK